MVGAIGGVADAQSFRRAISGWAQAYSTKYRQEGGPRPTVADAQQDLRRWSTGYWTRAPEPKESTLPLSPADDLRQPA